ncbi:MAG: hypothetical protein U1D30_00815 [Planctomycetota bacterium]
MVHLPTFEDLKSYVRNVLCDHADLDLLTPLMESTLWNRGQPCGIEYTLLAPRSVRLSAIWSTRENRLLFYDQDLERFRVTPVAGPDPNEILSRPKEELQIKSMWKGK